MLFIVAGGQQLDEEGRPMTSCEDWEWIDGNIVPAYLRRRSKRGLKEGAARTRYLTDSEELSLLQAASPDVRQAIILAIDTGLRREELFSLRWYMLGSRRRPDLVRIQHDFSLSKVP